MAQRPDVPGAAATGANTLYVCGPPYNFHVRPRAARAGSRETPPLPDFDYMWSYHATHKDAHSTRPRP